MLELSSEMIFPEKQYYKFNYILLSAIGLWPYDSSKVKQLRFVLTSIILVSFLSSQILALVFSEYTLNNVLKILSYLICSLAYAVKHIMFYAVLKNVKLIRKRMFDSWSVLKDDQEIEIIRKHANNGKYFTLVATTISAVFYIFAVLLQYLTILLDIIKPLNMSRPYEYFIQTEYFIDQQKYFHIIAIHVNLGIGTLIMTMVATETFMFVTSSYIFGLFEVASYRMQHILKELNTRASTTKTHVASRDRIIAAVDMHKRAIEFSDLLKKAYGLMYLFLLTLVLLSLSANFFYLSQIIWLKENVLETIRCIIFLIMQLIGIYAGNYAGQEFMDRDTNVYRTICNTQWYIAPLKTQKLILFLIQKTTKIYKIDAAGMFFPNFEGMASGLSLSVSYFMVLYSI